MHVFVDEGTTRTRAGRAPTCVEKLWWGGKVSGLRVNLGKADANVVNELVRQAWARKAPKSLARK